MASKLICYVTLWTTAHQESVLLVITPAVFVCIFLGWLWAISVMSVWCQQFTLFTLIFVRIQTTLACSAWPTAQLSVFYNLKCEAFLQQITSLCWQVAPQSLLRTQRELSTQSSSGWNDLLSRVLKYLFHDEYFLIDFVCLPSLHLHFNLILQSSEKCKELDNPATGHQQTVKVFPETC